MAAVAVAVFGATPGQAAPGAQALEPCRLKGVVHEARCGSVRRPLDPAKPDGVQIAVHFAVLPALSRHKAPDAVVLFAGGPGQSAIALAATVARPLARLSNRRDVVLIDQRGTGRSAPLECPAPAAAQPLREAIDARAQQLRLQACVRALQALPHGDLRHYTTSHAAADVEAVRQALGAPQFNLIGGSYGTRAALEYQRQFPHAVRRTVLDGAAPPDMVLPASFSTDNQAALERVFSACEAEAPCAQRFPRLRARWAAALAAPPREVVVTHPATAEPQRLLLEREHLLGLVRGPLYAPALASALPYALWEAGAGRLNPLFGLAFAFMGGVDEGLRPAEGMHFSVLCAEDYPRLASGRVADAMGADFGDTLASIYRQLCPVWPRGAVPPGFYEIAPARSPVLVMSGGADPVTPPRHGQRVAQALGARARHVVVPEGGHGLMLRGCLSDVVFRFIHADTDEQALQVDANCAAQVPRPPAFRPPLMSGAATP